MKPLVCSFCGKAPKLVVQSGVNPNCCVCLICAKDLKRLVAECVAPIKYGGSLLSLPEKDSAQKTNVDE